MVYSSVDGSGSAPELITISNNIIAEPLDEHPTTLLISGAVGSYNTDLVRNLLRNSSHCNPQLKNYSGRMVNNIIDSRIGTTFGRVPIDGANEISAAVLGSVIAADHMAGVQRQDVAVPWHAGMLEDLRQNRPRLIGQALICDSQDWNAGAVEPTLELGGSTLGELPRNRRFLALNGDVWSASRSHPPAAV